MPTIRSPARAGGHGAENPHADGAAWTRRLRFRHLEVLRAIGRHGSLTAAGAALGISQPAVSQWLADIESAAGAPLFVRGARLKPTPFAAPLLAHAERVLNDAARTVAELQTIRAGGIGHVRIGTMQVGAASLVPAVVMRMHRQSPGITLSLVEDVTAGLWARFERNELDLLVTRLDSRTVASGLPQRPLFADNHRVVCGPRHALARRRRVGWADAVRHPWVMPSLGTPLHDAAMATFTKAGVAPPRPLVASVSAMANAVLLAESNALGLMSSRVAARLQRQGLVVALPLALSPDVGDVGLVWREAVPGPSLAGVLQAFDALNQSADAVVPGSGAEEGGA